ncbi:MAG: delta-60 repeat domain-containing protein, partial [Pyrinomonadaceae bacterium]|nr:delta-60 repeat domain-containing protein [Pyrinomonadaceae bacterium]
MLQPLLPLSSYVSQLARLRLLLTALAFLICIPAAGFAQSALDGFDPRPDAPIRAIVVQPDGKILIGGEFTSLSPNGGTTVTRNYIARLNADGSLDTGFNADPNGTVYAIALHPNGDILIGGSFTFVGGVARPLLARLNPVTGALDSTFYVFSGTAIYTIVVQPDGKILTGGTFTHYLASFIPHLIRIGLNGQLDGSFLPYPNNPVRTIALQANGKILVGGDFTGFIPPPGGFSFYPRNYIARLNAVTGVPDYYDPNANAPVYTLAIQNDNAILAGGAFGLIGGINRNRLARLDPLTGLVDSFRANGEMDGIVYSIVVQPDCKILVGGTFPFSTIPLGGPGGVVRLLPDGTRDLSFKLNVINVYAVALQPDGKIVFGGDFTNVGSAGQQITPRLCIARYENDGTVDRTLNLNAVGTLIQATAIQPDGKILIGGQFTDILGAHRDNIARLNPDGTLDTTFNPGVTGSVNAIVVEADGRILVGGGYTNIAGQMRNNLARLDATGALDMTFNPNPNAFIIALVEQWDGAILAGGAFTSIGGQMRNNLARLDHVTGAAEMAFNPNPNPQPFSSVAAIAVQRDGKILVGGTFTTIASQMLNHIVRLDASGALDAAFAPVQNNSAGTGVTVIAIQENGKILVGGDFTMLAGQMRNRMARLDSTGALDMAFNPNANNTVLSIAVQADGKVLAGGSFTSIGGQPVRNRIARLDGVTGAADTFDPNANGIVRALMLQADGKLLAGGYFANAGGQMRNLFARLTNDTPALQSFTAISNPLAFFQTISTWTLGGASPQLSRVTFESSLDGVNYGFVDLNVPYSGSSWAHGVFNAPFRPFI